MPSPARLLDRELAVERGDPVFEAAQPGARVRVGAADAVVADLDLDDSVARARPATAGRVGLRVAGDVGERLGDDEVGGRLDRRRQPLARRLEDLDRDRRAVGEAAERRRQPAVGEHGGVDAAGQLAQLGGRLVELLHRLVEQLGGRRRVGVELVAGQAQVHGQRHQPLLGAVVEVALDPAPLGVAGLDDAAPARRAAPRPSPRSSAFSCSFSAVSAVLDFLGTADPRAQQAEQEGEGEAGEDGDRGDEAHGLDAPRDAEPAPTTSWASSEHEGEAAGDEDRGQRAAARAAELRRQWR